MKMDRNAMGLAAICGAILLGVAAMAATEPPADPAAPAKPAKAAKAPKPPKPAARRVVVSYFHGNMRCATCIAIEQRSKEAVEQYFPKELKKGTVVWQVVNFDEPGNSHFIEDYKLTTKSLVISFEKKGKETRFKVVNQVWQLIHGDPEQFKLMVKAEVEAMSKDPAK